MKVLPLEKIIPPSISYFSSPSSIFSLVSLSWFSVLERSKEELIIMSGRLLFAFTFVDRGESENDEREKLMEEEQRKREEKKGREKGHFHFRTHTM